MQLTFGKFWYLTIVCSLFFTASCQKGAVRELRFIDSSLVTIRRLGTPISTEIPESSPCLSPDGRQLYFSRRKGGLANILVCNREKKDSVEKWGDPTLYISCGDNCLVESLTMDTLGNMYFTSNSFDTSLMRVSSEIYCGTLDSGMVQWRALSPSINFSWASGHPSVTADGNTLYYVVYSQDDRPDPWFDLTTDIYVTSRISNNDWTAPQKLDDEINNKYCKGKPHITTDGNYLFFTRNARRESNIFSADICCSKRRADGSWSEPFRLPDVINSKNREGNFYLSPAGNTFYFCSTRHARGDDDFDIYQGTISGGKTFFEVFIFPDE